MTDSTSGRRRCIANLPPNAVIGMIHVQALPGTPHANLSIPEIVRQAAEEAQMLEQAGFDAVLIENMHDRPYLRRQVGPEIVAAMTAVGGEVRRRVSCPIGVQVLAGANREALAVAQACEASFIRAEGFVFSHVADEGIFSDADAGELLRYRRQIGAERIAIVADIRKKHSSHALTQDVDIAEWARAAEFFGADGVVVTGVATGQPASPADVDAVAAAAGIPVWVGSGVQVDDLTDWWGRADGLIVGSSLKEDGVWSNRLEPARLEALIGRIRALRDGSE